MDCNVIRDLIPLYVDGCCSEESEKMVREHIKGCESCLKLLDDMKSDTAEVTITTTTSYKVERICQWTASFMQSILLFVSFGLITVGVALEARTPSGLENGFWALNLVIPATGFMLSLANWYFVRFYNSRKRFFNCSWIATLVITLCAYGWGWRHYGIGLFEMLSGADLYKPLEVFNGFMHFIGVGILLTAVFCVLSGILSNKFAKMLGKV